MYCPNENCPDATQTGSPGEYRDEVDRCPRCGSTLVSDLPAWALREHEEPADVFHEYEPLAPVCTVANAALLPLIHSLLDAAGSCYFIRNERILDKLPIVGSAVVAVEPSRIDEARELLSRLTSEA